MSYPVSQDAFLGLYVDDCILLYKQVRHGMMHTWLSNVPIDVRRNGDQRTFQGNLDAWMGQLDKQQRTIHQS